MYYAKKPKAQVALEKTVEEDVHQIVRQQERKALYNDDSPFSLSPWQKIGFLREILKIH